MAAWLVLESSQFQNKCVVLFLLSGYSFDGFLDYPWLNLVDLTSLYKHYNMAVFMPLTLDLGCALTPLSVLSPSAGNHCGGVGRMKPPKLRDRFPQRKM